MQNNPHHINLSLSEVHETVDTTTSRKGWKKILAYLGPAYLVSVGYMDPGNWATDLQGGAQFGYKLIWVLLMSNLMAQLLQALSARLGIVTRKDLAQVNRLTYPPAINFCLYILAEIAIAACDLAEVLGMALGIHLLTGLPLIWGVSITVLDTFLLLWLQQYGIRKLEAFIITLVLIIGCSFLVEMLIAKPHLGKIMTGFIPTSLDGNALFIAVGIIGATVMPHNLYLHSALVQTRKIGKDEGSIRKALKYAILDSTIALNAAFFVNAAILILAACVFFPAFSHVAKIEDAHQLLAPLLGTKLAPVLFAIALIAAGQSSTITGTLAGQIVMEGYLQLRINPLLRRLITRMIAIVPAAIVILVYGDSRIDDLLIISQVVLSVQLGFAIIPLIHFVSDKKLMGVFAIKNSTKIMAWLVAAILIFLNIKMIAEQCMLLFNMPGLIIWKILVVLTVILFIWLFILMTVYPLLKKKNTIPSSVLHKLSDISLNLNVEPVERIAIALDFEKNNEKLLAHAIAQGQFHSTYLLIHVVESATAKYLGQETDDEETRADAERLEAYTKHLISLGYKASACIGYNNRIKEITKIVNDNNIQLLVMGAHGHKGLKDYVFGETIESVRHQLNIPVLIVNV